jgi:hypothetical protein
MTRRDQFAYTLEDVFDFENSPSLNAPRQQGGPTGQRLRAVLRC